MLEESAPLSLSSGCYVHPPRKSAGQAPKVSGACIPGPGWWDIVESVLSTLIPGPSPCKGEGSKFKTLSLRNEANFSA